MNSNPNRLGTAIRLTALTALLALHALAQNAYVNITSPAAKVLVHGQLQLAAAITDIAGSPLDGSGLAWSSSDATLATVSAQGLVAGVAPGDITVTAADSNTGAAASILLHSVPARITLTVTPAQIHAGDSAALSAAALDSAGNTIPGVGFQYRSGEPSVASVDAGGTLTGVAEGFATIAAFIPAATSDAALVATADVQILPAAAYTIKKLLSTDVTASTSIAAYSLVSASVAAEIGSIVTLANGGQAAVLIDNGKTKVLAVAGQALPNTGRMVLRLDAISVNSKGDVALLMEYPAQWCSAVVTVFPHGKPETEIGTASCGNGIHARSLADDGSVLYRFNDQIFHGSAGSAPQLLFSLATQPAAKDPVRNVNDFYPSPAGTFILNINLTSGPQAYLWFDGAKLTQVYKNGDLVRNNPTTGIDSVVGIADGTFYARANGNNFEALLRIAAGTATPLVANQDNIPGGKLGWIHSLTDASPAGVLLMGDVAGRTYHTSVLAWNGTTLIEYAPAAGWGSMISGAMLNDGTAVASAVLAGDTGVPGLRSITASGPSGVLSAAGVAFPQPAPAGIDWHYGSRGGSATSLPIRGAGDAIVTADSSVHMVLALGSNLPNGKPAVWIGGAIANQAGDILFTAGYPTGSVLARYRGGNLETLADTAVTGKGPGGITPCGFYNYRGRFLALNNNGDYVSAAAYFNCQANAIVKVGADGSHLVAQQNTAAPGGGFYTNFQSLAIDESGHVMFIASTSDGHVAAYYWDGTAVQRVIGTGDAGTSGLSVNEVSNIAGGGSGFVVMLAFGNYQLRELRSFDGSRLRTIESSDTSLFDGTGLSWYWGNECTLSADGTAHCQAQTQDGSAGVYAHRTDGTDAIVARSRDQLPGGEWMIMPLVIDSSAAGKVYFTADVIRNGIESLALYEATPR